MAERRPNVIMIMTDQQSAATLPSYGNPFAKTPHLDRIAAEGVQWDWAFVQQPVCVPSRISIHTGRYPEAHRSRGNNTFCGTGERPLPALLREAGYDLALCGKNHCFHPDEVDRWDYVYEVDHLGPRDPEEEARLKHIEEARAEVYHKRAVSFGALPYPKEEFGTFLIRDAAIRFLEQDRDRPFFMWLSFPDPHPPYTIPKEYAGTYDPARIPLPEVEPDLRDKPARHWFMSQMMEYDEATGYELKGLIATYYTMIAMIDDAVGEIMQVLKSRGMDEETLIVFLSDHGDFAGHHRMLEKGPACYDILLRVPLLFRWAGRISPKRVSDTMIESIDVMPTLLDYLGIEVPAGVQGKSARPVMEGAAREHRGSVYARAGGPGRAVTWDNAAEIVARRKEEHKRDPSCRIFPWIPPERQPGEISMVRTMRWKYVHHQNGEGELYDLEKDPGELVNRFDDPAYASVLSKMRAKLIDRLIAAKDPRLPEGHDPTLYRTGRVRP